MVLKYQVKICFEFWCCKFYYDLLLRELVFSVFVEVCMYVFEGETHLVNQSGPFTFSSCTIFVRRDKKSEVLSFNNTRHKSKS